MTLWIILAIILLGLILVFVEMFVVPGTILFGVLGGVAILAGVILMYSHYGDRWGNITTLCSVVALAAVIFAGFRVIQSNKIAMKGEITGKVNQLQKHLYAVGDKGVTVSELRPNGKATFNDARVDVYSTGDYIQRGSDIQITKITHDKIFVEALKPENI